MPWVAVLAPQGRQATLIKTSLLPPKGPSSVTENPGHIVLIGPPLFHQTYHGVCLGYCVGDRILRQNDPGDDDDAMSLLSSHKAPIIDDPESLWIMKVRKEFLISQRGHIPEDRPTHKKADRFGFPPLAESIPQKCPKIRILYRSMSGALESVGPETNSLSHPHNVHEDASRQRVIHAIYPDSRCALEKSSHPLGNRNKKEQEVRFMPKNKIRFTKSTVTTLPIPCVSVGLSAILFLLFTSPVWAAERQVVRGHLPAPKARPAPIERLASWQRLHLAIGLPLRNREALTNLLRDIYDPASPRYHHYLTSEEFAAKFGPAEKDYQAVIAYAEAKGLTVSATHPNRVLLDVSGTVADIEKALHVSMRVYQHPKEARTFYAPDVEPSLDMQVPVLHIGGLDNYSMPRPRFATTPLVEGQKSAPNAGSGPGGTYMGHDFRAAYVPDSTLAGSGDWQFSLEKARDKFSRDYQRVREGKAETQ